MKKSIITIWKTPSEAICVVADALSTAHFANAICIETLIRLPISCCRAGESPMPAARPA